MHLSTIIQQNWNLNVTVTSFYRHFWSAHDLSCTSRVHIHDGRIQYYFFFHISEMQIINVLYLQWFNISSSNMPHCYNKYQISKPNTIHVAIIFKCGTFCLLNSVFPAFCFSSCNFIQYLSFEIIQSIHINLALFACSNNKSRQNMQKKND